MIGPREQTMWELWVNDSQSGFAIYYPGLNHISFHTEEMWKAGMELAVEDFCEWKNVPFAVILCK